jgi:hypothetical protein
MLAMSGMFIAGYANVNSAGNTTAGLAAARQLMEDARRLPFDNLTSLDGFNTDDPGSQPADDPELEVARRWRYALAGEGVGWDFTSAEKTRWTDLAAQGQELNGVGTIGVASPSANLREISVTVNVPGRWRNIRLTTLVARL